MSLVLCQQLEQRLTLIQKLGLDSRYLKSCLVRSEALLCESDFQKPLRLLRRFADEDEFHSVLDFLVAIFVPAMQPRIAAFYRGQGDRLIEQSDWAAIDRLDQMLANALRDLRSLHDELRSKTWRAGTSAFTVPELTATWLDIYIRPRFAVPVIVEAQQIAA